jgi:hypothetical protein
MSLFQAGADQRLNQKRIRSLSSAATFVGKWADGKVDRGWVRVERNRLVPSRRGMMISQKKELIEKEQGAKPEYIGNAARVKFGVFGEEMLEKEVKRSGNTGRVYLPPDWVGKHVKIIRTE